MIGTVLDKYEILQKIGEGGMATVYRGRHTGLGRVVAIKVLHPHLGRSERNRQRFAREARAIEHLDHDNILRIFDYSGTDADECYIVTEFVDGVTLQQLLAERGRLPSEVVAMIGIQLAEALAYAHDLGIIHRDLKPENAMLRRDGVVKLMDFGIARFLDEVHLTMTGALVGSPAYMSPEQAMERVLDPRSDLFSLGTLLFHLVSGRLPFTGQNPSIILRNIIEGNRPGLAEVAPDASAVLADLVESLLQPDPDDRPAGAREVGEALRRVIEEVRVDPEHPQWSLRAWLVDPEGYGSRLREHLLSVLLEEGRARLDAGDHLGALRLFNRLLSIDEDNEEVLSLVERMHGAGRGDAGPRRRAWLAGGVLLVAVAGATTWALWPEVPARRGEAAAEEAPAAATMAAAAPAAEAAPAPAPAPVVPEPAEEPPPAEPTPAAAPAEEAPARPPLDEPAPHRPARPAARSQARPTAPERAPAARSAGAASAPAAAPEAAEPGLVSVAVQGGGWADITIDGEYRGRTGELGAIALPPGRHVLRLDNDLALPYTQSFDLAPGEHLILTPHLVPRPATLLFPRTLPSDCRVRLDGTERGALAALGWRITIANPDRTHSVELACADGRTRSFAVDRAEPGSTIELGEP